MVHSSHLPIEIWCEINYLMLRTAYTATKQWWSTDDASHFCLAFFCFSVVPKIWKYHEVVKPSSPAMDAQWLEEDIFINVVNNILLFAGKYVVAFSSNDACASNVIQFIDREKTQCLCRWWWWCVVCGVLIGIFPCIVHKTLNWIWQTWTKFSWERHV